MNLGLRTFALDPNTNDMYLDEAGNFAGFKDRLSSIGQLLTCRLQTFLGEVPTNLKKGVDYHGIIFTDFLTQQSKINELIRVIIATEGVVSVENFTISPDKAKGIMGYNFTIKTDAGNIQFQDLLK